jgi:glycosyltransferase involved in cell wall biosynthesis
VDVLIDTFRGPGEKVRKQSGIFQKLNASLSVWQLAKAVAKAATDKDVIYANTAKALVVSALASRMAGKPLIYHLHDILSLDHFSRSNLRVLVWVSNWRVSHVIANSEASKFAFVQAGGRSEVSICYNGFDHKPFDGWNEQHDYHRAQLRSQLRLNDQPVVAVFGRLAPWKGQHIAIKAMRNLPNTHLLLVGDALFGESDYRRQLEALTVSLDLSDRVHFLGFRDDVGPLMQAADVVVHCSIAPEPFGRVIVEAMLSRRPVVASRAGGAVEIIDDGRTGLLASPGDPIELSKRIKQSLEAIKETSDRVDVAYRTACDRFNQQTISTQISQIIAKVVQVAR